MLGLQRCLAVSATLSTAKIYFVTRDLQLISEI